MGNFASKSERNNSSETPNQLKKKTILNNLELLDPRSPNALITRTPIFVSIGLHSVFYIFLSILSFYDVLYNRKREILLNVSLNVKI